jgi:isopentenyl-diphosphate delta-isomerase
MTERIQFVDANDQPIGAGTREEAWAKGIHHRIARVLLKDQQGRLLLQHRSSRKKSYPDRWTDSASGHVDEGEDYETAMQRELLEEIGIKTPIRFIGKFLSEHVNNGVLTPVFNGIYEGTIDSSTPLVLQESEVSEVKWFAIEDLKKQIQDSPDTFTPGFIEVMKRYYV